MVEQSPYCDPLTLLPLVTEFNAFIETGWICSWSTSPVANLLLVTGHSQGFPQLMMRRYNSNFFESKEEVWIKSVLLHLGRAVSVA